MNHDICGKFSSNPVQSGHPLPCINRALYQNEGEVFDITAEHFKEVTKFRRPRLAFGSDRIARGVFQLELFRCVSLNNSRFI